MEKKTIGSFIAALRKANGLTQKQLADKLNVSDKAVSRWERDECAPDLSLIPVLAEIFGVTSDEILRGQRVNPDAVPREIDTAKADKQRKYLLHSAQSKFRSRSVISAAIAIIGLILACICNFELGKASVGFLLGSIFYTVAIVCQISGLLSANASIRDEEWTDPIVADCKGSLLYWTETIISATLILFALTLHLAGSREETVSLLSCLISGIKYALIAAVLCFAACLILNLFFARRQPSAKNRLQVILSSTLSVLMIGILVGHSFLNTYLINNRHEYAPCEEFNDLSAFRTYMEKAIDPEGYISWYQTERRDHFDQSEYVYVYGTDYDECAEPKYIFNEDEIVKHLLTPTDTSSESKGRFTKERGYEFYHLNRYVIHYHVSDPEELVPIYTFTAAQFEEANNLAVKYTLLYALSYLLPILICAFIYIPLRKKIK